MFVQSFVEGILLPIVVGSRMHTLCMSLDAFFAESNQMFSMFMVNTNVSHFFMMKSHVKYFMVKASL